MLAHFLHADEHLRLLPRAIEVQQRASVRERIRHLEPRAIPARPLIVAHVRINRIAGVEAMRQRDRRPRHVVGRLVTAPDFPGAAERALIKLPALRQALTQFGGVRRNQAQNRQ